MLPKYTSISGMFRFSIMVKRDFHLIVLHPDGGCDMSASRPINNKSMLLISDHYMSGSTSQGYFSNGGE